MSSSPNVRDLDECRNIQNGVVFIVASGGSAKEFHPEHFAHVPMITMNGAISKFIGTGVKPFFYACTDKDFSTQQPELFSQAMMLSERVALWEDHLHFTSVVPKGEVFLLSKAPKLSWGEIVRRDHELVRNRNFLSRRNRRIGFSKNLKRGFFDARTVAYLALQIAYHAGFTKAVLVGVDLNQSVQRFYEHSHTDLSPCGLDQHFHTRILPSFEIVSEKIMGERFQVYNLSNVSRIPADVIPQVSLNELEGLIQA
jgi:KDO transferase-3